MDIEEALRRGSERMTHVQSLGAFTDDALELEYEVVEESTVPHVREQLSHISRCSVAQGSAIPSPQPSLPPATRKPPVRKETPPTLVTNSLPEKALTARQKRLARKTLIARDRRRAAARNRDACDEVASRVLEIAKSAEPVSICGFNAATMPSSKPGWIGTKELGKEERIPERKLKDFCWNGKVTVVLLDSLERIWTVLGAPPPRANDWGSVNKGLMDELERYDRSSQFSQEDMGNRRSGGNHGLRNVGVSTGGGQPRPGNIAIRGLKNQAAMEALSKSQYLGRLVGHTGRLYATYANRLASESRRVLRELGQQLPELKFPTHPSPEGGYWAGRCINSAGLRDTAAVCTLPHTDFGNWAPGWCCVTAVGSYDPDKGGHMILWNVGLRIRFPPGCSILFPSAVITHSNVPIQAGERRYSIVEFSAGGLFRWVYNGYKTDEELLQVLEGKELERWEAERLVRWKNEVRMYTKWHELERSDYKGKVLEDESDLSELEDETDDERPCKRRRI
ncbi:hypothetical protein VNI00_018756 [Paramarasmius palmivorus]|uniref:Fe2OG dioxygenase domain-containing protein n=1 Tax=Paramarasmius palmivorus TaxID=297713 RepID=A0AAW0AV55_9AGAR